MNAIRLAALAVAAMMGLALLPSAGAAGFQDPLDVPAQASPLASKSLLQGVARAGPRLVAVGQRGHILYSTDSGATWQQAKVPVSSDLTSVFFVNDLKGWAVGHDGVILHSADGGITWTLQLDGRKANERMVEHMQNRVDANPQAADKKQLLEEAKRYKEQGADKPFLDVWFADENNGYAVGAYNLLFGTRDGGKNWDAMFDQTDNPKLLNLYAIGPAGGGLYIAGEAGLVMKLDPEAKHFKALPTPYNGSYFGVLGDKTAALVYGLRGSVYRTEDSGKAWTKIDAGLQATIVAGLATGNTIMLADVGGRIAVSTDGGRTFKPATLPSAMPISGITDAGNGRLARVGPTGVVVSDLTLPK